MGGEATLRQSTKAAPPLKPHPRGGPMMTLGERGGRETRTRPMTKAARETSLAMAGGRGVAWGRMMVLVSKFSFARAGSMTRLHCVSTYYYFLINYFAIDKYQQERRPHHLLREPQRNQRMRLYGQLLLRQQ